MAVGIYLSLIERQLDSKSMVMYVKQPSAGACNVDVRAKRALLLLG